MTVSQLIKELKKMPLNCEVAITSFDLPWFSCGDWANSVTHVIKKNIAVDDPNNCDIGEFRDMINDAPSEYVVIRG